jgi:hypothetical protein
VDEKLLARAGEKNKESEESEEVLGNSAIHRMDV